MELKAFLANLRGAQTRLAEAMSCPSQLVWQWQAGARPIPIDRCPQIERETDGAVPCEHQRPDIAWHRVPDADWPWHPQGRPLIDVARATPASQEVRDAA